LETPANDDTPIILAAPGTLTDHDEEFGLIDAAVRRRFPDVPIQWVYTSPFIRKRLAGRKTIPPTLEAALRQWIDRGFAAVRVQPLQVIPGVEFHRVAKIANSERIAVALGRPLLDRIRDYDAVLTFAQSMLSARSDAALVLVAHGTPHPARACYEALAYRLAAQADRRLFLACLSGEPSLQTLSRAIADRGIRAVTLLPFLIATGGHILEEIAGRHSRSWRRQLEKQGIAADVIEHGLSRFSAIVRIFLTHLEEVYPEFFMKNSG
jgi:sirohydrochlorin cobaltochelatase